MDTALLELIKFLKEASPVVWDAAIRQVYVKGFADLAGAVILLLLAVVSAILLQRVYKEYKLSEDTTLSDWKGNVGEALLWIALIMCSFFGVITLILGAMYLANPAWYAIEFVISTVK